MNGGAVLGGRLYLPPKDIMTVIAQALNYNRVPYHVSSITTLSQHYNRVPLPCVLYSSLIATLLRDGLII